MPQYINIQVAPEIAFDEDALHHYIIKKFNVSSTFRVQLMHRSIDSRNKHIKVNLKLNLLFDGENEQKTTYQIPTNDVSKSNPVIVIGFGPAGMFASLKLIELGLKPIVIERGKKVQARRHDLAQITKQHLINPDSNYCFGEGGAGTYSDGKLYTRSTKRGDVQRILEIFVAHGAHKNILVEAHPHIGTNKLPKIVENIRQTILQCGGEIYFETKLLDFEIRNRHVEKIICTGNKEFYARQVILATGHSARDIYYLLHKKGIYIENKPFAIGVRIEHPQRVIDAIQYHCEERSPYLPPASYALATQIAEPRQKRGVFSFCMCPGGIIAPCATAQGEVVVNGWSPSGRNNNFANSGIVAQVNEMDWNKEKNKTLAALHFQESIEKKACVIAGNNQTAPAQNVADFVMKKNSSYIGKTSYHPGVKSVLLDEVLPEQISQSIRDALKQFGKKMNGFVTNEAHLLAVESRTSAPIRILRDKETFQHVQISNLYPCGEGSGYAGGIVSAAIDGERCAEAILKNKYQHK